MPNGMRVPGIYGVLHGEWYLANPLGHGRVLLYTSAEESPGDQWHPSDNSDDRGRPLSWSREVAESDLERLVRVLVSAKWRSLSVGIQEYIDGTVFAFVDGGPKEEQIRRGEIPEITIAGRSDYHGKLRWEDITDLVMSERELLK
ncbi:hypothetical protein AO716_00310 [Arthrobacter sp. Edens01]|nr:hypothetical protein AO716_00310 [Arthrobacter sp. Edens01]